ncbi:cytochrome c3 family protein [Tropicimonas sp. TH_r6]|uniref:cytochrome c3 family protein n=1 Tax=Tropicimonas sp. TH_r6 TaxID=3082085 RepID=UPI0029531A88|nr:cytochrome c3 family protein [Tropicimonas sp. TH_r6]MDV7144272.1 cytochrome c3 family protein [Tropicimonas sp. TH_r6]
MVLEGSGNIRIRWRAIGVSLTVFLLLLAGAPDGVAEGDQERAQKQLRLGRGRISGHDGTQSSVLAPCSVCHLDRRVLPDAHAPTGDVHLAHCRTCHAEGRTASSIKGILPLDHIHALAGLGCQQCHGDGVPMIDTSIQICTQCHGPQEALAARTRDSFPVNPHISPHDEMFEECSLCHFQHSEPIDVCSTCHDFAFFQE